MYLNSQNATSAIVNHYTEEGALPEFDSFLKKLSRKILLDELNSNSFTQLIFALALQTKAKTHLIDRLDDFDLLTQTMIIWSLPPNLLQPVLSKYIEDVDRIIFWLEQCNLFRFA